MIRVLGLLLAALPAAGAIAFVNSTSGGQDATTTSVVSGSISATTGNFIYVALMRNTAGTATVSDNAGNTYVAKTFRGRGDGVAGIQVFTASNITGNAALVVTATVSVSSDFTSMTVLQYSGIRTTAPSDVDTFFTLAAPTNNYLLESGTFTTTFAEEVIIVSGPASGGSTTTAGSGYSIRQNGHNSYIVTEDQIVASIQTGVTASLSIAGITPGLWTMLKIDSFMGPSTARRRVSLLYQ